jgi:hypothetical protein
MHRNAPRAIGVLAITATLAAVSGSVTGTRPATAQTAGVTARLAAQTLLLGADQTATVVLDVAGGLPADTEVATVVHNRLTGGRERFQEAAAGDIPTAPYRVLVAALGDVPRDAAGRLVLEIPTTSRRSSATGTEIPLRNPGVYPVEFLLREGDSNDELARVVTFLVRLPDEPLEHPMRLALVMPVSGPPALQPDGRTALDTAARTRIQTLTDLLASMSDVAVGVQLRPELLEALGRTGIPTDETLRARLLATLPGRQALSATFVTMDAAANLAADLDDELVRQLRRGEDVLADLLGPAAPDRTVWTANTPLDDPTVGFLRDLGFRQLLVEESTVEPGGETTNDRPFSLPTTGNGRPLAAAAADPALSDAFAAHVDPAHEAYTWLAEVAFLALRPPDAVGGPRGVVVLPEASWDPNGTFLNTVLTGLRANPLVVPVTPAQLFDQVAPAETGDGELVTRSPAASSPQDLTGFAGELGRTRRDLASYGSMVAITSPLPAQLGRLVEVSPSADLDAGGRTAYLDAVESDLQQLRAAVEPIPDRTITLAGRTTDLPITITTTVEDPLQVKLRLSSSKLAFPEGNEVAVTVTGGSAQVRIPVEARTSGTFAVTIDVLTPVGDQPVTASSQLTVRSTGLSGLGLALSVGALIVLALWWASHVRRGRRRRRNAVAALRHPSATGAAAAAN